MSEPIFEDRRCALLVDISRVCSLTYPLSSPGQGPAVILTISHGQSDIDKMAKLHFTHG